MTLHTYLGRTGTGKSMKMLTEIKQKMKADPFGDSIILVASTQSTFQLEQVLVNDPELNGSLGTEVLYFERLSHRIFQEVGSCSEQKLFRAVTEMMTYNIVQEQQKYLKLYQSQAKYYGFSEKLTEQIQDFRKCAVTPEHSESFIADKNM